MCQKIFSVNPRDVTKERTGIPKERKTREFLVTSPKENGFTKRMIGK
jgi:hypothetical protein